jgi:hypothetical protein
MMLGRWVLVKRCSPFGASFNSPRCRLQCRLQDQFLDLQVSRDPVGFQLCKSATKVVGTNASHSMVGKLRLELRVCGRMVELEHVGGSNRVISILRSSLRIMAPRPAGARV